MKKITFLIAFLGAGGAERVTSLLANHFVQMGYDVQLIVFSSKYNEYEIDKRVRVEFLPEFKSKIKDIFQKTKTLRKLLKQFNPEYVFELGFSYRYLLFGNLLTKYQFIMSERNAPQLHHKKSADWKLVEYCFRKAYRVVFQTEEAREYFSSNIRNKSIVIPNPIREDLPPLYQGTRDKRIVAFSRLNHQKNIPMMLRVFKEFVRRHDSYVLEIYGRGECESELKQYASEIGVSDQVLFKGFERNIHSVIQSAAMFISTSDYEGISNSMLEAMAIGLPCVCTDCPAGGARMAIQSGYNGFLVPVRDEERMLEMMDYIVYNEDAVRDVSSRAAEIKKKWSIGEISVRWESLIK